MVAAMSARDCLDAALERLAEIEDAAADADLIWQIGSARDWIAEALAALDDGARA